MRKSLRARALPAMLLLAAGCGLAERTPTEADGGVRGARTGAPPTATAMSVSSPTMDILPTTINYTTTNLVQVRIYSSAVFDAATITPSTVRFVIDGILSGAPVATFPGGAYMTSGSDLNGDGLLDRILQFRMTDLKAAGLNGPNHQLVVQGQAASGAFQASDPTPPAIVNFPPVAAATITPGSASIAVGGTVDLDVQLFSAGSAPATGRVVTWSSLDAAATVDASGVVTGQAAGLARIVATAESRADTAEVTVS